MNPDHIIWVVELSYSNASLGRRFIMLIFATVSAHSYPSAALIAIDITSQCYAVNDIPFLQECLPVDAADIVVCHSWLSFFPLFQGTRTFIFSDTLERISVLPSLREKF